MPTLSYAKNKQNIYNWRKKYNEHHRENQKRYCKRYNAWVRIKNEFLKILIDDAI